VDLSFGGGLISRIAMNHGCLLKVATINRPVIRRYGFGPRYTLYNSSRNEPEKPSLLCWMTFDTLNLAYRPRSFRLPRNPFSI
jgi:hypothetical protein